MVLSNSPAVIKHRPAQFGRTSVSIIVVDHTIEVISMSIIEMHSHYSESLCFIECFVL